MAALWPESLVAMATLGLAATGLLALMLDGAGWPLWPASVVGVVVAAVVALGILTRSGVLTGRRAMAVGTVPRALLFALLGFDILILVACAAFAALRLLPWAAPRVALVAVILWSVSMLTQFVVLWRVAVTR